MLTRPVLICVQAASFLPLTVSCKQPFNPIDELADSKAVVQV